MFSYLKKGISLVKLFRTHIQIKHAVAGHLSINSKRFKGLATEITANVTTTTEPAGTLGWTTHDTGKMNVFVSDGAKWQALGAVVS